MRTNCLDCLDRTNVVQSKMTLRLVQLILDQLKQLNKKSSKNPQREAQQDLTMMGFTDTYNDPKICEIITHMWAENGDVISKQYAGTSSTITSVTKTGKQGFFGKLQQMTRGVERFIVNNMDDGHKHECIKMFLNLHP